MLAISLASILLASSPGSNIKTAKTSEPTCVGTVAGGSGESLLAFDGTAGTKENSVLPPHYKVDIVLPDQLASKMACSVTGLRRKPDGQYSRALSCTVKGSGFSTFVLTHAEPDGTSTAMMGLMGPASDSAPAAVLGVNCFSN